MQTDRVEVLPRYILMVCTGTMNSKEFVVALNRGLESAARSGRRAVLIDALNVQGSLTTVERFELGSEIARAQRAQAAITAIVVVGHEPPLDPERFAETVAINRGAVGKSFTGLAEAEQWIDDFLARVAEG
ncbi:hypothetical protein [Longimicrobium sp.]|uniref:hypothetical protein n=1 Tax=Longimicrobium sp. TaxID=2029185 RepID=UPI002F94288A